MERESRLHEGPSSSLLQPHRQTTPRDGNNDVCPRGGEPDSGNPLAVRAVHSFNRYIFSNQFLGTLTSTVMLSSKHGSDLERAGT